jgi:hypothetical protein
MALTDVEIKRAKAKDKAYRMSDSGGMYLWVTPAGGKLLRWAYVHERKGKLMSFGRYPDSLWRRQGIVTVTLASCWPRALIR